MSDITWANRTVSITTLMPAAYNPRKHDEKQFAELAKSLDKFSLADPIVVNSDGTVIGGHFRLEVLKSQGVTEVEVRVPNRHLRPEEEKELNIRLNKNMGDWDFEGLAAFGEEELKAIGFDPSELEKIFKDASEIDVNMHEKDAETYLEGGIRQIVLYFKAEDYEPVLARLKAAMEKTGTKNHTEAILHLLELYENNPTSPQAA